MKNVAGLKKNAQSLAKLVEILANGWRWALPLIRQSHEDPPPSRVRSQGVPSRGEGIQTERSLHCHR